MIWIDFTFIGLIFVFFVTGLLRGFAKEVFSLAFWILAVWVSLMFSRSFSVFWEPAIKNQLVRIVASFMALFAITLSLGGLIGFLVSLVTKKTELTFMDRFWGMVLGIFRGMVVVTVIVIVAGLTPLPKDSWWKDSTLIPPFQMSAVWLRDHFSPGLAEYISYR
ncbi:CvpA family protein [Candidatus Methylobacter oryzae]|uniref:CvpA family protein n=1 Tax=Candidatus Methylobacter oryzae TaxID=2497749 RepID=A0ABY3C647_9GAMM|nr:CvpA family protein [Candidatus Methylobacter oryzae]TRW90743.1 CvpA family protein [Candidatus Methylobacter oryzae]